MRIGKELADVSAATLGFFRQIGVEEVSVPPRLVVEPRRSRPLIPPPQRDPAGPQSGPWDERELRQVCDRVVNAGLAPTTMHLPISGAILMGAPGRDADIERVCECIRAAGRVGIRTLTYAFTALRASEGYYLLEGAGGGGPRRYGPSTPPASATCRRWKGWGNIRGRRCGSGSPISCTP
jgi:hypothetical protein